MSNITQSTKDEIIELSKKFQKKDIEDILKHLSKTNDNNEPIAINTNDIVYKILIEFISNKYQNLYQTYTPASLYPLIVSKVEKYILESCDCVSTALLRDITTLSEMTYESDPCSGSLVIYPNYDDENFSIQFDKEDKYQTSISFDKSGLKYLRKLLQVSKGDMCLAIKKDGDKWLPVGYLLKENCSYPTFTITGPLSWTFTVANEVATFSRGRFIIKKSTEHNEQNNLLVKKLSKCLNGVDESSIQTLIKKVVESKEIHGALLVFIDDEQQEVINNLCQHKRGIKIINDPHNNIKCPDFLEKTLLDICKIDGAVVFDKSGQLLSIGTILDGRVINDGDVGRGSRYNSTKTFVEFYSQHQSEWAKEVTNG